MSDKPYFIDGQKYMVKSLTMKASELLFWRDNPRIFEKIRRLKGEDFNQEDIYTFFNEQPTTRNLLKQIKKDGGVNEELFVKKLENESDYTVFEGNTRLAVVKHLYQNGSFKSEEVKVAVLPEEMDQGQINAIIGQFHLTGKADWEPYETNAYIEREFLYRKTELGHSQEQIYQDMISEFNIKKNQIKQAVKTVGFMKKYKLTETSAGIDKFSYWNQYVNSQATINLAKIFNEKEKFSAIRSTTEKEPFDDFYIKTVFSDNCPKAVDVRDIFQSLYKAYDKGEKKPLEKLIAGKVDPNEAKLLVNESKVDVLTFFDKTYNKLKEKIDIDVLMEEIESNPEWKKKLNHIYIFLGVSLNLEKTIKEAHNLGSSEVVPLAKMQISSLVDHYANLAKSEYVGNGVNKTTIRMYFEKEANDENIQSDNFRDLMQAETFPDDIKKIIIKNFAR